MILYNNLSLFLVSLIPIILILLIFKKIYPEKSYGVLEIIQSLMIGSFCIIFVNSIHFIFPFLSLSGTCISSLFIQTFFQIALIEEMAKYSGMFLISSTKKILSPMDILFYSVCTSASFAFIENLQYMQHIPMMTFHKMKAIELLFQRFYSSTLLHITCGFIMGTLVAYGKNYGKNMIKYSIFGILAATILHGLYDFNIMIRVQYYYKYTYNEFNFVFYSILVLSFIGCIYLFKKTGKMEIMKN